MSSENLFVPDANNKYIYIEWPVQCSSIQFDQHHCCFANAQSKFSIFSESEQIGVNLTDCIG